MRESERYFSETYEEAREKFRKHLEIIKQKWPNAELQSQSIGSEPDNTIDMIYADALGSDDQLLFFTSGEHGIEGYAGAAVISLFIEEYLDRVDPETTGICFVHALNPWGMRHFRRVTENNIDLNRNYLYQRSEIPEDINKEYEKEHHLFVPHGKITNLNKERVKLNTELLKALSTEGYSAMKTAKGMGQYEYERGVYFGGRSEEESALFLKDLQKKLLKSYRKIVHMDWHTALGPSNEITMVVSDEDGRSEEYLKQTYGLNNIQKFSPNKVKGDSTNHFHKLKNDLYPSQYLFSALFEFGTFGTGKKAELREFNTIVLENRLYWEGAENEADKRWIQNEFLEMFYPPHQEWREAVVREARTGLEKVLGAEEIFS